MASIRPAQAHARLVLLPFPQPRSRCFTSSALVAGKLSSKKQQTKKVARPKEVRTSTRRAAPGERKALRKAVILENPNVIPLSSETGPIQPMTMKLVIDGPQTSSMVELKDDSVKRLQAVDAFKHHQAWRLMRKPAMIVTSDTKDLLTKMAVAKTEKTTVREIISGPRATGKSGLLLQAMAAAFDMSWTVIPIPEAQDLILGSSSYRPSPSNKDLFIQPGYTATLLTRIVSANPHLSKIQISQKPESFPIPIREEISLSALCTLASTEPELSVPIFELLWKELLLPGRPPVLLTVDNFNHWTIDSAYPYPSGGKIHAQKLSLVALYSSILNGTISLPNGGAVLAATTTSNNPKTPELDLFITPAPVPTLPFQTSSPILTRNHPPTSAKAQLIGSSIKGASIRKMGGLTREETAELAGFFTKTGIYREKLDWNKVSELWTLSGGRVGEVVRTVIRKV